MNLKPCPNPECDSTGNLHRIIDAEACWVECTSCRLVGPDGETEEKGDYLWNLMPRRDDSQGAKEKYALPIRVKTGQCNGWLIGFGVYDQETLAIVAMDEGNIKVFDLSFIEVDNDPEA